MTNETDKPLTPGYDQDPAEYRFLFRHPWAFGESRPNRDATLAAGGVIRDVAEDSELAEAALIALNQAIEADLRRGGIPLDECPSDGAFYFAAQQYLDAAALLEALPRNKATRAKLQRIHKLARELCSALTELDLLTLRALEKSELFGRSYEPYVVADLDSESIKEIFGSLDGYYNYIWPALHNDRYHLEKRGPSMLTTFLGHIRDCAERAAENVPQNKGGERHPAGRIPSEELVRTCVEIFAVYCPSKISGSAGSLFQEFVSYAQQAATGTHNDCGRHVRSIVKRYRQIEKQTQQACGYQEKRWAHIIKARRTMANCRVTGLDWTWDEAKRMLDRFTYAYRLMDRNGCAN